MKINNNKIEKNFLKKIFIKLCRFFGYEIIDQNTFTVPSMNKNLNENLSIPGKKSIILPLGEVKITRSVNDLTIIFRSCTSINMLTQNKERMFNKEKSEYTFRSLYSLLNSIQYAKKYFSQVNFKIIIVDYNSEKNSLNQIKKIINKFNFQNEIISLDMNEFSNLIDKKNAKNEIVTDNQKSNMANIFKSLLIARKQCSDLVYFVEDDYIHHKEAIKEMIFTYERIASQTKKELILCPADYPYLYNKLESTNIFLGSERHWRIVSESLVTFLTSVKIVKDYWENFSSMCKFEHYPFEEPLHKIYEKEYCLSPIPSLVMHCTNVNSIFGLSPILNWKEIWEENENY